METGCCGGGGGLSGVAPIFPFSCCKRQESLPKLFPINLLRVPVALAAGPRLLLFFLRSPPCFFLLHKTQSAPPPSPLCVPLGRDFPLCPRLPHTTKRHLVLCQGQLATVLLLQRWGGGFRCASSGLRGWQHRGGPHRDRPEHLLHLHHGAAQASPKGVRAEGGSRYRTHLERRQGAPSHPVRSHMAGTAPAALHTLTGVSNRRCERSASPHRKAKEWEGILRA